MSQVTVESVLPVLTTGSALIVPTPEPEPSAPGGIYTSEKYWYTIEVPLGWNIDASDDDSIVIWDPRSGATVWVSIEEIDPHCCPTLDSYVAAWEPAPADVWTDFQIVSDRRIRTNLPVQAQEFVYGYTYQGSPGQGISHWYVLGRYKVTIQASADEAIWTLAQYAEIRSILEGVQDSFQPEGYASDTYGYSVAHPPRWEVLEDPAYDYSAYDSVNGSPSAYLQIASASGYTSISSYGLDHTVLRGDILSRQVVFAGRPNSSYRIDYTYTDVNTGKLVRGSVLITLSGGNAIWVFIDDYAENWTNIQGLVDDIFLRVAVTS